MTEQTKITTVNVDGIRYEIDQDGCATGRFMDGEDKPNGFVPQIVGRQLLSASDPAPKYQSWEFG